MKINIEKNHRSPLITRDYIRSLEISLLICVILATISAGQVPRSTAQTTTPTYVLGVSNPTDPLVIDLQSLTSSVTILPGVSSLSLIGPNSVLFIDGNWLQSVTALDPTVLSTILAPVLNGLPTIVIRGNAALIQDSVSGLLKIHEPNLPLISEGVRIFGTLSDGTRQSAALLVIAGFDYAVSAEFGWAQQILRSTVSTLSSGTNVKVSNTVSPLDISTTSGTWTFIGGLRTDSGDMFKPMGRIFSDFTVFKLQNSGSSTNDWFNYFANQTLQPGIVVYNSPWRDLGEQDHVQNSTRSDFIVSHGPTNTTTSGPTTVTFTIPTSGTLDAATTASQTDSFFLKNANLTDTSQTSQVQWLYSINPRASSGKLSFSLVDGWTDRTTMGNLPRVSGTFTSSFATLNGSNLDQTASTTIAFATGG